MFSHNPADGSFAALPDPTAANTKFWSLFEDGSWIVTGGLIMADSHQHLTSFSGCFSGLSSVKHHGGTSSDPYSIYFCLPARIVRQVGPVSNHDFVVAQELVSKI